MTTYYTPSVARAQKKYNKEKTTTITIKLHNRRDADILAELDRVESKQGHIKNLIRKNLK